MLSRWRIAILDLSMPESVVISSDGRVDSVTQMEANASTSAARTGSIGSSVDELGEGTVINNAHFVSVLRS